MNKELILALIESFVDEKISQIDVKTPRRGSRGIKGADGIDGKDGIDGVDGSDGNSFDFEQHKENIEQIILENKNQFTGKRGPKGSPGSDFDFESNKEVISNIILDFFNSSKNDLKLKFSDLSIDDLNSLKLKFSDLTESEIDSLKVYGPRGQRGKPGVAGLDGVDGKPGEKGEPGEKGARGQRGRTGISGDDGKPGEKGDRGERGIRGLPGLTGLSGKNGISGLDGQDAPRIVDIELNKVGKEEIYFTFYFSDGSQIETESIKIPIGDSMMAIISGGSSSGNIGLRTAVPCESDVYIGAWVYLDSSGIAHNGIATSFETANVIGVVENKSTDNFCDIKVTSVTRPVFADLIIGSEYFLSMTVPGDQVLASEAPGYGSAGILYKLGNAFDIDKMEISKGMMMGRV